MAMTNKPAPRNDGASSKQSKVQRRSGSSLFGTRAQPVAFCPVVVEDEMVVSKTENKNPARADERKVLGKFVKEVSTMHLDDDEAASAVHGELERLRDETGDSSLQAVQLTCGMMADYSSTFAIYRPEPEK
ncbi:MAG: hypothetical protein ABIH29_03470 [Candidatus Micrarchaeota archaeon]